MAATAELRFRIFSPPLGHQAIRTGAAPGNTVINNTVPVGEVWRLKSVCGAAFATAAPNGDSSMAIRIRNALNQILAIPLRMGTNGAFGLHARAICAGSRQDLLLYAGMILQIDVTVVGGGPNGFAQAGVCVERALIPNPDDTVRAL